MMSIPYNDCAHVWVVELLNGAIALRCSECDVLSVSASVDCEHPRVLGLPPFHFAHGAALNLRQCDVCKRIGTLDRDDNVVWMREVQT